MARRKVTVKNLRVNGNRIPDSIWRKAAAKLLPGPDPTPNELKNGAPSKPMVLKGLCEVDSTWRKKAVKAAAEEMAVPIKAAAVKAGWIANSEDHDETIQAQRRAEYREEIEAAEQLEIQQYGHSTLTSALRGEDTESVLAAQLSGRIPLKSREERDAELMEIAKMIGTE